MINTNKEHSRRRVRTPRSELHSSSQSIAFSEDHFFMSGGIRKRRIFHNVRYTEEEMRWVQEVRQALKREKNIEINQKEQLLRYYYSSNLQMDNCLSRLQHYHQWFNDPQIQNLSKEAIALLKNGFVYSYGVSKDNHPFSIMNLGDTDFSKYSLNIFYQAINHVNNKVIRDKFVPGHIESYDYILDLNEKFLSLQISSLKEYIQTISDVYSMRMHHMFIINCTTLAKWLYSGVEKFLSEETTRKIKLFTKEEVDNGMLLQFFEENVLQVKYGGKKPNIDHTEMFLEEQEENRWNKDLSETEYFSIEDNNSMFQKEERDICCGSNQCTLY